MTEFELFADALEVVDPAERGALLARVCGDDGAMRERVERLLKLHEANSGFMNEPSATTPSAMPATAMFNRSEADTAPSGFIEVHQKELANDHPPEPEPSLATEDLGLSAFIPQQTPAMPGLANFEIEQTIGKGGMGIVLKALDKKLKREVAIKVLAPHLAAEAEAVQRFFREAQAAAAVRHDNVVTIHAVDEANDIPFLVMELINGESLQDRMKRGPLPADEIVWIGIQIASGLDAAHRRGLIHRDIKPANILLEGTTDFQSVAPFDGQGVRHTNSQSLTPRVKITDFGLARVTSESAITRSGLIAGTPQYMSPEQANGQTLDHRSDLFSLGSVLYSLCTGQTPFHAESAIVVLRRVTDHEPVPIRSLNPATPDWLCEVIAKLMAKQPEDRIQTAKEVADLLTRCQAPSRENRDGPTTAQSLPIGTSVPPDASLSNNSSTTERLPASSITPQDSSRGPTTATWKRTLIAVALLAGVVLAVVFGRSRDPKSQASRGASAPGSSATESVGANEVRGLTHPGSPKAVHPLLDDSYEWTPPVDLGPGINGDGHVDHASISSDGLLMVMARIEKGRSQKWQLWWSARKSDRDPFPAAAPLPPEVNSDWNDLTPFLSRDGLSLWFASDRPGGAGSRDLYVSRRKSVKDPFEHPASLGPTINTGDDETSPFVTADELTLLFAAGAPRQIFQAKRKSKDDSFGPPQRLANINDMFWQEFPRLSQDGLTLVLVVSKGGGSGQRLSVASRPSVDADFSKPVDLGSVNRGMMSGPSLSSDETTLYFSTGTHTRGLWMSRRVKKQSQAETPELAKSRFIPSGEYTFVNNKGDRISLFHITLHQVGAVQIVGTGNESNGVYRIETKNGWLVATSSDAGAVVKVDGSESTATDWEFVKHSKGYAFACMGNRANFLSLVGVNPQGGGKHTGEYHLRRSNAGGNGMEDQVWQMFEGHLSEDEAKAKSHQEACAKQLDLPVEYTNSIGMKFRLIPPGEFLMGSTPDEIEAALKVTERNGELHFWGKHIESQGPQHKVVLTKPIYVGVTEVSQSQYEQVMGATPSHFSATGGGKDLVANLNTGDHPVEDVTWNEAGEFCAKLSQQELPRDSANRGASAPGQSVKANADARDETPGADAPRLANTNASSGYRLLTEAEWEYACRAGTITQYWIGNDDRNLTQSDWFFSNSGGRTHPVGKLKANPFGLLDMHGNVWEYVLDGWDSTFFGQFQDKAAHDPFSPRPADSKPMARGGSGILKSPLLRSATRLSCSPPRNLWTGFRVALTADAVKKLVSKPEPNAPPPAVAPFDATQAKQHQEAWAKHLGLPVEYTNSIGMKFHLVPPGEFLMGSTPEEIEAALKVSGPNWREHIETEGPQHKVILTKPIYVGETEVTQSQYKQVMGKNPSAYSATGKGKAQVENMETGNHPVEMVSWNDAAEFCGKLSQQEKLKPFYSRSDDSVKLLAGAGYRLPTEAEWEFACRAGTSTRFWSGNQDQDLIAACWHNGNGPSRTHAAGGSKPNPFGLSDMHGNVWEWVQDGWDPAFYSQFQTIPARDPSRPFLTDQDPRPLRGGDWHSAPFECRSAMRLRSWPTWQRDNMGFRVVLPVEAARQAVK